LEVGIVAIPGTGTSILAGALAGIGASACCVGPFVLVSLGIGGAWVGTLVALEPFRPVFIAVTITFLGLAYRGLYLAPEACAPGRECADPQIRSRQRTVFWVVTLVVLALVGAPYAAPLFP